MKLLPRSNCIDAVCPATDTRLLDSLVLYMLRRDAALPTSRGHDDFIRTHYPTHPPAGSLRRPAHCACHHPQSNTRLAVSLSRRHNSVDERMAQPRPASLGLEGTPFNPRCRDESDLEACLTGWGSITARASDVRAPAGRYVPALGPWIAGTATYTYVRGTEIGTYVVEGPGRSPGGLASGRDPCVRAGSLSRPPRRRRAGEAGNVPDGAILTASLRCNGRGGRCPSRLRDSEMVRPDGDHVTRFVNACEKTIGVAGARWSFFMALSTRLRSLRVLREPD